MRVVTDTMYDVVARAIAKKKKEGHKVTRVELAGMEWNKLNDGSQVVGNSYANWVQDRDIQIDGVIVRLIK